MARSLGLLRQEATEKLLSDHAPGVPEAAPARQLRHLPAQVVGVHVGVALSGRHAGGHSLVKRGYASRVPAGDLETIRAFMGREIYPSAAAGHRGRARRPSNA